MKDVFRRIRERGDDGVWISTVAEEDLRARAAAVPGDLPLAGLTFAVKDNIDVAGLPTTAACPDFAYLPDRTAPVVRRLLDAGALLVGKTNLDQFATGLTGARSPYGSPESVFGGGLIPGGSSSGSAVAVAAGLVDFALGTDTAGSGRVPAALNGIVGVKPTRGLLSTLGVVPACRSLDCVSVFAREVPLADAVLRVARGLAAGDPWGRTGARPLRAPADLRIGTARTLEFFGDAGQEKAFAAGLGRFRTPTPVDIEPLLEAGDLLYRGPWVAERLADLGDFLTGHPDSVLPVTRSVLETGLRYTAVDAWRGVHRLRELRAWTDRLWETIDVLVLPTIGTTYTYAEIAADPIGRNLNLGRYTQFANLLDLAAVTVPNGFTADGRPASLTLFGPAFSDDTLTLLAAAIAEPPEPQPVATAATAAIAEPPEPQPAATAEPQPAVITQPAEPQPAAIAEPAGSKPVEPVGLISVAVVGLHLSGEPRNAELTDRGATLVRAARTAPRYRLYRLPSGVPGLVRDDTGGAIDVEIWQLPVAAVGSLLAGIPAPLSLGRIQLADGGEVTGFLCEAYAAGAAEDITAGGGWRAYRSTPEGQEA